MGSLLLLVMVQFTACLATSGTSQWKLSVPTNLSTAYYNQQVSEDFFESSTERMLCLYIRPVSFMDVG